MEAGWWNPLRLRDLAEATRLIPIIRTLIPIIPALIPIIPTLISRIPNLIPYIPTLVPIISTLIPRIPILISIIPSLIPCILRIPTLIPHIPIITFPDTSFRLLQIACNFLSKVNCPLEQKCLTSGEGRGGVTSRLPPLVMRLHKKFNQTLSTFV